MAWRGGQMGIPMARAAPFASQRRASYMPLQTVQTAPFVVRHSVTAELPPLHSTEDATMCCVPRSACGSRAPGREPSDGGDRDWLFVGEGRGGYEREYKYVGEGHGSFTKAVDEHGGLARRCCKCCIACVLVAVVATLLWIWIDPNVNWPPQFHGDHGEPAASGEPVASGHLATVGPIATSVTSTSTTPDPTARCLTLCSFDNVTATCQARVQWAAYHLFGDAADRCDVAYSLVMGHCASCRESGCAPAGAGCAPGPNAPRPNGAPALYDCGAERGGGPANWSEARRAWCCAHERSHCVDTAARARAACQEQCKLGPEPGTCGSQVRRLAGGPLAGQRSPCALGLGLVLHSCPQCGTCTLLGAGCEDANASRAALPDAPPGASGRPPAGAGGP